LVEEVYNKCLSKEVYKKSTRKI